MTTDLCHVVKDMMNCDYHGWKLRKAQYHQRHCDGEDPYEFLEPPKEEEEKEEYYNIMYTY